jgi:uncharacterized membrane protein HdeD (DUF308 family)
LDKIKNLFKKWDIGLIFGIGMAISGLILLILPGSSLKAVCFILGIGVGAKGVIKIAAYLKAKQTNTESTADLISAIVILIAAFVLIAHPKKLISIIPILIGIGIIIYGVVSFFNSSALASKITSAVIFFIGIGIVGSPFAFAEAVTAILGFALIVVGVITAIKSKNKITLKIEDKPDDGYTEVDFTDVDE